MWIYRSTSATVSGFVAQASSLKSLRLITDSCPEACYSKPTIAWMKWTRNKRCRAVERARIMCDWWNR